MDASGSHHEEVILAQVTHPYRWLYAGFWIGLAILCVWFLSFRPDSIIGVGLIASLMMLVVTWRYEQQLSLSIDGERLIRRRLPLGRWGERSWSRDEITEVVWRDADIGRDTTWTGRPFVYQIDMLTRSGRFMTLLTVYTTDQADQIVHDIERFLDRE